MDKKAKKKIEVLRQRIAKLQKHLSRAHQKDDEPGESQRIAAEIKATLAELEKLKA